MKTNLGVWDQYGEYVLPIMPFMDNIVSETKGSWIIDVEGNRILDLASGQFCTILGHNHPKFISKLCDELKNTLHTGSQYMSEHTLSALNSISNITPGHLNKIALFSTGSEANEFALRVAKTCTGRTGVLGFDRGYYGITHATRNLSAISGGKIDASPVASETWHIIAPNCARCPLRLTYPDCDMACLDLSLRMLGHRAENLAAIIVEPILSAGGMIYPPSEYFSRLTTFAREVGALVIVDEAQTGFGRCGRWFDCENLAIEPDILVFSKTSGNGYPSAGVAISKDLTEKLLDRGMSHLSSHQNDPLAAAAVQAVIEIINEENYISQAHDTGAYFLDSLKNLEEIHQNIASARGRGLMLAFELVRDKEYFKSWSEMLNTFVLACKSKGVHLTYTYYEGALRIIPGLNLTKDEVDFAINVFSDVLRSIETGNLKAVDHEQNNKVIRSRQNRNHTRIMVEKVWDTSPRYWVKKLREKANSGALP